MESDSLNIICLGVGLLLVSHLLEVWQWSRKFRPVHRPATEALFASETPAAQTAEPEPIMLRDVMRAGQQLLDALERQQLANRQAISESTTLSLAEAREFVDSTAKDYAAAMERLRGTELAIKFVPYRGITGHRVGAHLVM